MTHSPGRQCCQPTLTGSWNTVFLHGWRCAFWSGSRCSSEVGCFLGKQGSAKMLILFSNHGYLVSTISCVRYCLPFFCVHKSRAFWGGDVRSCPSVGSPPFKGRHTGNQTIRTPTRPARVLQEASSVCGVKRMALRLCGVRQRTRLQGVGEKRAGDNASPLRSRGFDWFSCPVRRGTATPAEPHLNWARRTAVWSRFRGVLAQLLIGGSGCFQGNVFT